MQADQQSHLAFYLTGTRAGGALHAIDEARLRPALLASYRNLSSLRYDYPLVLLRRESDVPYASLSSIMDGVLAKLARVDSDGERLRKHLLRLEQEMRTLFASGTSGTLSQLWKLAAERLAPSSEHAFAASFSLARAALGRDGQLTDCDESLPARLFIRAWRFVEDAKARQFHAIVGRLTLKLSDILRADFIGSAGGREPQYLKASVGPAHEAMFDFDILSTILGSVTGKGSLSKSRHHRIENTLGVLRAQRFFPSTRERGRHGGDAYSFVFASCADVAEAYRERMPKVIALAKALAIAELEVKGEYNESRHDALFDAYGEHGLPAEELERFPAYLLCMYSTATDEYAELMALLGANVPVKALVQFDDLIEESGLDDGAVTLTLRGKQLADMAMGLGSVYVLQSAASNLVQFRDRIVKGLAYNGPGLFSVYSGVPNEKSNLPAYLAAAVAMESRAFPAFSYDPSAGPDWATRFSVADNPQAERDWPAQPFTYEDRDHQKVSAEIDFTLVDFAACDPRYARHFAKVPAAQANGHLLPVRDWLAQDAGTLGDKVPFLMMVDERDVLERVIVDASLIEQARRCKGIWHSLQELGGIHNSHAERLLARERTAWEQETARALEMLKQDAKPGTPAPTAAPMSLSAPIVAPAPVEAPEEKRSDEPYIETPRCTTCEECIQINNKMFVYDANKQAYIADLNVGTYRQLVEAAESCQVSIIHPGKPGNRKEPGIEELLQRAEPFL